MIKIKKLRAKHIALGARGEKLACRLLQHDGMEFVAQNWRTTAGELDLVMRDGDTFVFVEVKTKRKLSQYRPLNNLSRVQIKRNMAAAKIFMRRKHLESYHIRFDLVEVICSPWRLSAIYHHKDFVSLVN